MLLNRTDILAYLTVLNYGPVLSHFDVEDRMLGRRNIMGCLVRLYEQLDALVAATYDSKSTVEDQGLLELVRYREGLNGFMDHEHPQLKAVTKQLAELLYFYFQRKYGHNSD